jgi:hypothetical protein
VTNGWDELRELNVLGVVPRPWSRTTEDGALLCDWCGTPFKPPKPTGRTPRYCRRSCRQRAFEARETHKRVRAAEGRRAAAGPRGVEAPTLPGLEDPAPPPDAP